ncbi:HCP-like protein [Backusella circina FSU 941]|nr:HCP-like protein [Backusella circina FSU 941]
MAISSVQLDTTISHETYGSILEVGIKDRKAKLEEVISLKHPEPIFVEVLTNRKLSVDTVVEKTSLDSVAVLEQDTEKDEVRIQDQTYHETIGGTNDFITCKNKPCSYVVYESYGIGPGQHEVVVRLFVKDQISYVGIKEVIGYTSCKVIEEKTGTSLLLYLVNDRSSIRTACGTGINIFYGSNITGCSQLQNSYQTKKTYQDSLLGQEEVVRKAEDMNSSDAIFELGRAYQYGYGVDIDSNKAVKQYMLAATLGNPLAQHTLGMLYDESTLVPLNTLEALKWYTKAYSQGYDAARSNLFQLYDHSPYQDFFYQRLHILLECICSLGPHDFRRPHIASYNYHCACQRLGYWYYQQLDFRRAWKYFSKSISKSSIFSEPSVLESKYISSDHKNEILNTLQMQIELVDSLDGKVLCYLGKGYYWGVFKKPMENKFLGSEKVKNKTNTILKQDYPKAFFFLEKAAKKGNTQAQYYVGTMYHHGYGVETDFGKAQEWYDKASTDTQEYALKVGMVYHCDGEFQDFSKALRIYEEAGVNHAGLVIGMLYQYGTGVEKNYKKAKKYFKKKNGGLLQSFYLGVLYYDGPDDIQDYKRAFRFFQKEIEHRLNDDCRSIFARCKNDSEHVKTGENYSFTLETRSVFQGEAYYYLGIMYKNGQGTAQNELEAKKCFFKAIEYGNKQAKQYIE